MDTPTTAGQALSALRIVRAAVDHSPDPIPRDLKRLVGSGPVTLVGGRVTANRGRTAGEPSRQVSLAPWSSERDGIPWEHAADWWAPPLLLATSDPMRLDFRSVAYGIDRWGQITEEPDPGDPAWSIVHGQPGRPPGERPRVGVIDVRNGAEFPATPRGSHLVATAAYVARQVADNLDGGPHRTDRSRRHRREASVYRAFADTAEAAIPATFSWLSIPGIADLVAAHNDRAAHPEPRRQAVAARPYGTASAGPIRT